LTAALLLHSLHLRATPAIIKLKYLREAAGLSALVGHKGCRKVSRRLWFPNCQRLLPALTAAPATPATSASAGTPPFAAAGRGGAGRGLQLAAAAACQPRVSVSIWTFVLGKHVHLVVQAREHQ
jgi:hypothetical protein